MNYLHYTQVYFKWFLKGLYIFPICLAKVFLCTFAWLRSDSLWMRIHYLFFSIYSVINILSTHLVLCFFPPKSTWDKINVIFKRSHVSLRGIANHHSLYLFFLSLSLCINFILLCNSPCPNPQSSVLLVKVLHLPMKVSSIRCEVKVT